MKATEKIELVVEFLERKCKLKPIYQELKDGSFNRIIKFEIEGREYYIEWWSNQCYLRLENNRESAYLPFKSIRINANSPTTKHKYQLCFFDEYIESNNIPFGSFKIPFNY